MYSLAWIHNKQKGQAVLRLLDQLHRSVVLRLEREELAVLLLALLRRVGDLGRCFECVFLDVFCF